MTLLPDAVTRRALVITCVLLAATSVGSLMLTFQIADYAHKSSVNRVINCVQIQRLQALEGAHGITVVPEPLCENYDIEAARAEAARFDQAHDKTKH